LKQLKELFLDGNDLTGTIPPELGQLVNATYIALAENELTGVIPPAFGMLSNLQRLDLQFNNLVGQVPQQLSNLPLGKTKACKLDWCAMHEINLMFSSLPFKHRKDEIRGKFFLWQYS
jgi:Leucine-rich repeat (LRR) protein